MMSKSLSFLLTTLMSLFLYFQIHGNAGVVKSTSPILQLLATPYRGNGGIAPYIALSSMASFSDEFLAFTSVNGAGSSSSNNEGENLYNSMVCLISKTAAMAPLIYNFNGYSNGSLTTAYNENLNQSMRKTYYAAFDPYNNLFVIHLINQITKEFELVASQIDKNLPFAPPTNGRETLHISSATNGPQVIAAWIDTIATTVQTLFFTGTKWVYNSQPLAANEVADSVHTAIDPLGQLAIVGCIAKDAVLGLTHAAAMTFDSEGALQKVGAIASAPTASDSLARIRFATNSTNPCAVFNLGDGDLTYSYSSTPGSWTNYPIPGPFDLFDFGMGPNSIGQIVTSSIISAATNIAWKLFTTDANGFNLTGSSPSFLNNGFENTLSLAELRLATTTAGRFAMGVLGNAIQAITGNPLSGFFSSFIRPNNAGIPNFSIVQGHAPTGYQTQNNIINNLSTILTTFAAATNITARTTGIGLSSFVDPFIFGSTNFHAVTTLLENEGEYIIELLSSLGSTDKVGRASDSSQLSYQVGQTYSP